MLVLSAGVKGQAAEGRMEQEQQGMEFYGVSFISFCCSQGLGMCLGLLQLLPEPLLALLRRPPAIRIIASCSGALNQLQEERELLLPWQSRAPAGELGGKPLPLGLAVGVCPGLAGLPSALGLRGAGGDSLRYWGQAGMA